MIKVGVTGQTGFIGNHLYNFLGLHNEILRVPFESHYFDHSNEMEEFVRQCDVIVHLAAVNRHANPVSIYETNIRLVQSLIQACKNTNSKPHVILSSSTQETGDSPYGKSKREGRLMFEDWARCNGAKFTGLIIPNVYGPFGNPYYNSVVATFCHQLTHNEEPQIHIDATLELIYVNDLVDLIYRIITEKVNDISYEQMTSTYLVPHSEVAKVSDILSTLTEYKDNYFKNGHIPDINNSFRLNLFNTFRCYMPDNHFPFMYQKHEDNRGEFIELIKANSSGQSSYSLTKPGVTRGDHFHIRKAERFSVFKGSAIIQIRKIGSNKVVEYELDGKNPAFVDMPVWHTHNIINTGQEDLYTFFWINELFNPKDPDTYFEKVCLG